MNNKGLTLIELLAVVIILSLLALFVIPKVLEVKENKEKELSNAQKQIIYTDAATYIRENNSEDIETGQVFCINVETLIDEGYISMDAEDFKNEIIKITVDENDNFIYDIDDNCSGRGITPNRYKETILNGTDPVLNSDMIPITIDNDGTVKKADLTKEWYKYADKKWANAIVPITKTVYKNGDTIPESNIKAYYVWIPRYSYQLFESTTPIEIQIQFENKKTTKKTDTTTGKYYTHPAFTYGTQELNGFWVGKFETSVVTTDTCYTSNNIANCNKELTNPRIKPNVKSLRYQQVVNQYKTSLKVSNNSRMMKNDEWGAVAYLSHSTYGKNSEVRINNNSNFITGCGASDPSNISATSTCQIAYGNAISYPQSTTGNISGIFDMSGGAWEYMMSVLADPNGNPRSGYTSRYYTQEQASDSTILGRNDNAAATTIWNSGFNGMVYGKDPDTKEALYVTNGTAFPDSKNYNLYDNPSNRSSINGDNGCNGSKCYGHALTETKNWYSDYYYFPSVASPWVKRGGNFGYGARAGVFCTGKYGGGAHSDYSFRCVVPAS